MRKIIFALTLTAGVLAGCSAGADETATNEENDTVDVTQETASAEVAGTGNDEIETEDEEVTDEQSGDEEPLEEAESEKELFSHETTYYRPAIPDNSITPEQWQDLNSVAYLMPEKVEDAQVFASLEDYLASLRKSWQPESDFRQELPNSQFEEDSNLALSANVYLNHFAEEAANLGIKNEIDALKEAAFTLHRNFYGSHQEKLNETLRQDFEQRLNHVTDLLEIE
ncbi:membrane lipoprotein lipid attachment site-containing protein [Planococcus lenghuensis]|uniref:NDxxF motif lipoprotein n=1 Tax=Planococcus lenghuensis TaxID=2213202 RepID=A0A1Q2KYI6_9BACL|nr:membrane lipoprotein lipid attachment site-containing protein [Planococcus lenghuensis]AQQ53270.1 hypothetical protein B0X71_09380 [Planococcus lenghuensis]